jgi:ribose/xylose/arabinose/galactoside ABC-type transport system permease subunit
MKKTLVRIGAALALFPALVGAQSIGGLMGLLDMANQLINRLIPFVITLALLVFLWGILKYVFSSNGEGRDEAKGYMIWGIIGLFVMVSVWGLVNILVRSLSLDNTAPPAPGLPNPGGYFTSGQPQ